MNYHEDWGVASTSFDTIKKYVSLKDLSTANEAQTRYDIINRIIKEVLCWDNGRVSVEENDKEGGKYVDYILRSNDHRIVVEAKKIGAAFPSPTKQKKLKIGGSLLGTSAIEKAIKQAIDYSKNKLAQITVVTNGMCWCIFLTEEYLEKKRNASATLLFPFDDSKDAERLFNLLSNIKISKNGIKHFAIDSEVLPDNRLLTILPDSDFRIGRNNVAEYLAPVLDNALYSDAFINQPEYLEKCLCVYKKQNKI
ncbi:MAG: hypothetical protein V1867_02330 [Candidatus Falkowbacteria bacterium]